MDKDTLSKNIAIAKMGLRPRARYAGTVDESVFPRAVILKTAYVFFDSCHFLFKKLPDSQIEVTCVAKNPSADPEKTFLDFSNELTNTLLRESISENERSNREKIYAGVMGASIPNETNSCPPPQNADKSIEEVLREIEAELGIPPSETR